MIFRRCSLSRFHNNNFILLCNRISIATEFGKNASGVQKNGSNKIATVRCIKIDEVWALREVSARLHFLPSIDIVFDDTLWKRFISRAVSRSLRAHILLHMHSLYNGGKCEQFILGFVDTHRYKHARCTRNQPQLNCLTLLQVTLHHNRKVRPSTRAMKKKHSPKFAFHYLIINLEIDCCSVFAPSASI